MTIKIRKSQLQDPHAFDVAVAAHAHELRNWRAHMQRVAEDAKNPDIEPIDRHMPYPAPIAHELINQVLDENGSPNYELVDDPPEEMLAAKKAAILAKAIEAGHAAIAAVLSPAKQQLHALRALDIRNNAVAPRKNLLQKIMGTSSEAEITPEDADFLANFNECQNRISAIQRQLVQVHSDIEDLSIENVDAYQLPTF